MSLRPALYFWLVLVVIAVVERAGTGYAACLARCADASATDCWCTWEPAQPTAGAGIDLGDDTIHPPHFSAGPGRKFCPECQQEGQRSAVYRDGFGHCTTAYCEGDHWDEDGVFQPAKPCNTCTTGFRCSRGHTWSESSSEVRP